ncbi:MAG TPA: PKD domain-containing protein, partial [Bacteroidales bacterium]|nr:PKD domain-containing protein [Bacteroidales bacterium]
IEGINTVSLDFDIPAGTDYQLKCGTATSNLWRNNTGTSWPYDIGGVVSITGTNAGDANYYYYFYNWEIMTGDECVSARTPVTATINSIPDLDATTDVTACDLYILPSLINGEYFLSSGGINPISAGYEITTTTTVYVYAETGTIPNCTNENSFTVTINETPVVDNLPDVEVCDLYTIPVLTNGQCYNNLGTLLPSGTMITESQVITIYAETGTTPNCFAESSFDVTINSAAQVDIGDNLTSECGGTVTLDAGIGYTSYSWNGVAGDQTYEATSTGTYTVVVEDVNGCTSTDDVSVTILDSPTVSVITTPESAPGANDGTATANVSEGTAPYSLTWQSPYSGNPLTGLSGGFYCVTVQDFNNCIATDCGTVNTNGAGPVAAFEADVTNGCNELIVQFTDLSSNTPTSWTWDFGDGATSDIQNPMHTYTEQGSYTVTLSVENDIDSDTETLEDYIYLGESPSIEMSMTQETILGNDGTATVIATGGVLPYDYWWNTAESLPTITGLYAGEYCVTVFGDDGCQASDCIVVTEEGAALPVADFTADDTDACETLTVQFTDLTENYPTSWEWDFGDGGTSTEQNPEHTYSNPGTFTVSLTITNSNGEDEEVKTDYISVYTKPELSFSITHETGVGNADGEIELTITGGSDPYTINWSNNEHDLIITGLSAGLYSVAVIDDNGCMATGFAEVQVVSIISDSDASTIKVYPNPSDGHFLIESQEIIRSVQIFDATGKLCFEYDVNSTTINISDIKTAGLYFIKIETNEAVLNQRLVIK